MFSDLEMAQISLSWHRFGDMREERELCRVAGDRDPEMPGTQRNRQKLTHRRKYIVDKNSMIRCGCYLILQTE